jgi:putative effector of murein hydrolase
MGETPEITTADADEMPTAASALAVANALLKVAVKNLLPQFRGIHAGAATHAAAVAVAVELRQNAEALHRHELATRPAAR